MSTSGAEVKSRATGWVEMAPDLREAAACPPDARVATRKAPRARSVVRHGFSAPSAFAAVPGVRCMVEG